MLGDNGFLVAASSPDTGTVHPEITGWCGSESYFRFIERAECDASAIADVLRGRVLGAVIRDAVPTATRTQIISRFLTSPARRQRGADAPGEYLGAYHYGKTTDDYLTQSEAARDEVRRVLDVPHEPLAVLHRALAAFLADEGVDLRPARHDGRQACRAVLRSWNGRQAFALEPHEDRGQCEDPVQAGFEIQGVAAHHPVGLNVCLDNGPGGRLVVWNVRPDEAARRRLGVLHTGSPYPAGALAGFGRVELEVRPGDIYLFNAAHVHAVEPVHDPASRRITLSGALGFIDPRTVATWT